MKKYEAPFVDKYSAEVFMTVILFEITVFYANANVLSRVEDQIFHIVHSNGAFYKWDSYLPPSNEVEIRSCFQSCLSISHSVHGGGGGGVTCYLYPSDT